MKIRNFPFLCSIFFGSLFAESQKDPDIAQVSEAFGHIIGNHLKYLEVPFDIKQLVKGIQDASDGKDSPLSKKECIEAIGLLQEKKVREIAVNNLVEAEAFLHENAKQPGMIVLNGGKVQYYIATQGNGSETKSHFTPLIRYKVKTLDGSVGDTTDEIETLSLNESIEGLKIGLVGMKEGEKRVLYIHPDLAYGAKNPSIFPPNSLLIFEVEMLKADSK